MKRKGWIYTLHLFGCLGTSGRNSARHYTGFAADNVDARIAQHRNGTGARILAAANEKGIAYIVVDVRRGTRDDERRIKKNGHHDRRCYICKGGTA